MPHLPELGRLRRLGHLMGFGGFVLLPCYGSAELGGTVTARVPGWCAAKLVAVVVCPFLPWASLVLFECSRRAELNACWLAGTRCGGYCGG